MTHCKGTKSLPSSQSWHRKVPIFYSNLSYIVVSKLHQRQLFNGDGFCVGMYIYTILSRIVVVVIIIIIIAIVRILWWEQPS